MAKPSVPVKPRRGFESTDCVEDEDCTMYIVDRYGSRQLIAVGRLVMKPRAA